MEVIYIVQSYSPCKGGLGVLGLNHPDIKLYLAKVGYVFEVSQMCVLTCFLQNKCFRRESGFHS